MGSPMTPPLTRRTLQETAARAVGRRRKEKCCIEIHVRPAPNTVIHPSRPLRPSLTGVPCLGVVVPCIVRTPVPPLRSPRVFCGLSELLQTMERQNIGES